MTLRLEIFPYIVISRKTFYRKYHLINDHQNALALTNGQHEQVEEVGIHKNEVQLLVLSTMAYPFIAPTHSEVHDIVTNAIPQYECPTNHIHQIIGPLKLGSVLANFMHDLIIPLKFQ